MLQRPTKILITGAAGLLGRAAAEVFRREAACQVAAVDRDELDITEAGQIEARLEACRPDLVINCAALANVDACEDHEEEALRVNGQGAGLLARLTAGRDVRLIHISTDYVFSGNAAAPIREEDATGDPAALSAYGRSKLLGEQLVRSSHPRALIVRTAWLYGPGGRGFPEAILRQARAGAALRVVNDQTGSPTYAPDLAAALHALACLDIRRIIHVTNAGSCTWHAFACEILRLARIDAPIEPIAGAELGRPAKRPAYSVLDNSRYRNATGAPLRPWRDAIQAYIEKCG